jgi:IPT/TIG domain-containing protein
MQITDITNPDERKKLIWAIGLGVVALVFLWWTFFGFGGSSRPNSNRVATNTQAPSRTQPNVTQAQRPEDLRTTPIEQLVPVNYKQSLPDVPEAGRNIFAYYEKPKPAEKPTPTPTPTPTPPVLLAGVSPSTVFARTDDFTLEAAGDKFTPELRITIDGQELPTRFVGSQQLSATVPASLIANAGSRQVVVKSTDGRLYSNQFTLNVNPPPTPNFTYIGIIGVRRGMLDTAMLLDKSNREVVKAQRGDVLSGRFRVTSISEKELVVVDTSLKIKHTLPFSTERERGLGPSSRPTPRVDSEDDEP